MSCGFTTVKQGKQDWNSSAEATSVTYFSGFMEDLVRPLGAVQDDSVSHSTMKPSQDHHGVF